MPRLDEDEFQIVAKLSACQISGTWGEGLEKLLISVLFTQGYPREKMPFTMLAIIILRYAKHRFLPHQKNGYALHGQTIIQTFEFCI